VNYSINQTVNFDNRKTALFGAKGFSFDDFDRKTPRFYQHLSLSPKRHNGYSLSISAGKSETVK
jgi:hypothetical protein